MIEERYVNFETAKLLKEKGFDGEWTDIYVENPDSTNRAIYPKITQQMALAWLREIHHIHIEVSVYPIYGKIKEGKKTKCGLLYWYYIASGEYVDDRYSPYKKSFVVSGKSYEEAVDAAILECLTNLI